MADRALAAFTGFPVKGAVDLFGQIYGSNYALNSSWTKAVDEGNVLTTIKDVQDGWYRIECEFFASGSGSTNIAAFDVYDGPKIALYLGTLVASTFKFIDLVVTKDYSSAITSGNTLTAPYEKTNSNLFNKRICTVGDSVVLGGWQYLYMQYCYGLRAVFNHGVSGHRMVSTGGLSFWDHRTEVTAETTADAFLIMASANDCASPIGTIDSVDDTTYLGAYNKYVDYLIDNTPIGSKIVLITCPFIVGTGNSIAVGKAAYEQQFINMANGVKALGVKYNLPVIDLHGLTPMTFENSGIYLSDKVHWTTAMNIAAGDIIGKELNDLY